MTTQISSQCEPIVRQQVDKVTVIKAIVHWHY